MAHLRRGHSRVSTKPPPGSAQATGGFSFLVATSVEQEPERDAPAERRPERAIFFIDGANVYKRLVEIGVADNLPRTACNTTHRRTGHGLPADRRRT